MHHRVPRGLLVLFEVKLQHCLQHQHAQTVFLAVLRLEVRPEEGEDEAMEAYGESQEKQPLLK